MQGQMATALAHTTRSSGAHAKPPSGRTAGTASRGCRSMLHAACHAESILTLACLHHQSNLIGNPTRRSQSRRARSLRVAHVAARVLEAIPGLALP